MKMFTTKSGNLINIQDEDAIQKLPHEVQENIRIANETLESMADDIFDFDSEKRVRQAGYTPQQAEDIAYKLRIEKIQVGQIFQYGNKSLVLTPFKTVVPSQNYMTALQDRLYEITTVDQEVMVSNLKAQVQWFTSLSFFGLIKLAFKRLISNLKGKNNG